MRQRAGLFLMLLGLLLAIGTTLLVVRITNQAAQAGRGAVPQVGVVIATRDILDQTLITADAVTVKTFPADFAPTGALGGLDQVVGKFAKGFIAKEQLVVAGQITSARRSENLSDRVPPGRVAVWLPMPELLASTNALKPGDRLDILLSVSLPISSAAGTAGDRTQVNALSTQTTLQNVEVFRIGQEELSLLPVAGGPPPAQPAGGQGGAAPAAQGASAGRSPTVSGTKAIGFLVDHQDAVIIKFVKDSGGTIDLALRSAEEQQVVRTEAVTLDTLVERFRFRVPQPVSP